jgi:hypothetical protein
MRFHSLSHYNAQGFLLLHMKGCSSLVYAFGGLECAFIL